MEQQEKGERLDRRLRQTNPGKDGGRGLCESAPELIEQKER